MHLRIAATLLFSMACPVMLWLPGTGHQRPVTADRRYFRTLRSPETPGPGPKVSYIAANASVINARAVGPASAGFVAVKLVAPSDGCWASGRHAGALSPDLSLVAALETLAALRGHLDLGPEY